MSGMLLPGLVAVPFAAAAALAVIGSWRIGIWVNLGAACVLFLLAGLLTWRPHTSSTLLHAGAPEVHLVLLGSFIAMISAWFSRLEVPALLTARSLDRRRVRLFHVAWQTLMGGIVLALLAESPMLTWLGMTMAVAAGGLVIGVVRNIAAVAAASRLALLCGAGLILALFGTLLLYLSAEPHAATLGWGSVSAGASHDAALNLAAIALLLGYGAVAAVLPLHAWLADAVAEGVAPGAIIVSVIMVNVPLLAFMHLRSAMPAETGLIAWLLIALGLTTLLVAAASLFTRPDLHRTVAFAGTAQIGMVVFAIGIGDSAAMVAAWVGLTVLALARSAVLQCDGLPPNVIAVWTATASQLVLAMLPLFTLLLLAGPAAKLSGWLLLPLGSGAMLASWAFVARLPTAAPTGRDPIPISALLPIWMQLGLAVLLVFAMPAVVAGWFYAVAAAG